MAANSRIEWTEATWNPVTGCSKVSPGCKNCYAERIAIRLNAMGQERYRNGFQVTEQPDILDLPLRWKQPRLIFVNSMSDLFHENISLTYIQSVFTTMRIARQHVFQVLTKRADRLVELNNALCPWPSNVWIGASVESEEYTWRIDRLRQTSALTRFLSLEPLLGSLQNLDLNGIHWVVVGGESGPRSREMKKEWVTDIKRQCDEANVPFFFKQWGGINKKRTGRVLNGKTYNDMPSRALSLYPV